jgi:hypothetical protein
MPTAGESGTEIAALRMPVAPYAIVGWFDAIAGRVPCGFIGCPAPPYGACRRCSVCGSEPGLRFQAPIQIVLVRQSEARAQQIVHRTSLILLLMTQASKAAGRFARYLVGTASGFRRFP